MQTGDLECRMVHGQGMPNKSAETSLKQAVRLEQSSGVALV